jgi:hypothetical protein
MLRVCGVIEEQPRFLQMRCWCHGLFCGRGGARLSTALFRAMRKRVTAATLDQFREICAQVDLFAADAIRDEWLTRIADAGRPESRSSGSATTARRSTPKGSGRNART